MLGKLKPNLASGNPEGNSLYCIVANGKLYNRRAWTGGDTPDFTKSLPFSKAEYDCLVEAFYWDQIHDASLNGKLSETEVLAYWECAGTMAEERRGIFMNRARLDAWRTLNP